MRFSCALCAPFVRETDDELIVACGADAELERMKSTEGPASPIKKKPPPQLGKDAIRIPPKLSKLYEKAAEEDDAKEDAVLEESQREEQRGLPALFALSDAEVEHEEARIMPPAMEDNITTTYIETGSVDERELRVTGTFDYDVEKGELFYHLENKHWDDASLVARTCPEQAGYWINRKNVDGSQRWRMLPIHSAIIYDAPSTTIQSILEAYPEGVLAREDRGIHPLQLAYRLRRSPSVISVLEEYYVHSKTRCWPMKEVERLAI